MEGEGERETGGGGERERGGGGIVNITPAHLYNKLLHSPPVCEWSDDQSWCVAEIFVRVLKLCITNVSKTVLLFFIPPTKSKNIKLTTCTMHTHVITL